MQTTGRTSTFGVSIALVAIGLLSFVFTGCEKKAAPPPPPPHSPESYMNDPAFRKQLSAARVEHQKAVRSRNEIAKKMQAKIEALKARLGTDDNAKLKPELEKDAEWNDLLKQCQEANAKIAAQRKGTLSAVKERLTPPKPISK